MSAPLGPRRRAQGAGDTARAVQASQRVAAGIDEPLVKLRAQPKRDIRARNKGRPKNWRYPMCSRAAGICQCPTCQVCGAKFKARRSNYAGRTVADFCNCCARNWDTNGGATASRSAVDGSRAAS